MTHKFQEKTQKGKHFISLNNTHKITNEIYNEYPQIPTRTRSSESALEFLSNSTTQQGSPTSTSKDTQSSTQHLPQTAPRSAAGKLPKKINSSKDVSRVPKQFTKAFGIFVNWKTKDWTLNWWRQRILQFAIFGIWKTSGLLNEKELI